jgi:TPR repeat protein
MKEFEQLLQNANAGNVEAMFNLAEVYYSGDRTPLNISEYFFWTKRAAESGHPTAMFNCAQAFRHGLGVEKNTSECFKWTKLAAVSGDVDAMYLLGLAYESGEGVAADVNQYFSWIKKAAELGSSEAMFELALAYEAGEAAPKDIKLYFSWLKKSAFSGDAASMFFLAMAYRHGEGTKRNIAQYIKWLNNAAESGNSDAMYWLAHAYATGLGVPIDSALEFSWLKKAAEESNEESMYLLALSYLFGEGTNTSVKNYLLWMERAAETGHSNAAMLNFVNRTLSILNARTAKTYKALLNLFFSVQEIKKQHLFSDGENLIAHFTPYQTIEKMLPVASKNSPQPANNHLRLYNVEYLNDPYEGRRIFQYMSQSGTYKQIYQELFNHLDTDSPISLLHEDLSIYVCSFTLRADRLDLWRAYGRDGEGVCIVTPLKAFENDDDFHALGEHLKEIRKATSLKEAVQKRPSPDENDRNKAVHSVPRVLYRVKYEDSEIDATLRHLYPHLKAIALCVSKISDKEEKCAIQRCAIAVISDILFLFKNPEYKTEEEARLVFAAGIDHHMLEFDEQSPAKLFVRTDNFLFGEHGSQIVIGPKVKEKKSVELNFKFRLNRHGLDATKICQSKVAYR